MPVTYNYFNPALASVILVVSSDQEVVTIEIVEELVTIEAFELSVEELADCHSMHFKHGGMNSS